MLRSKDTWRNNSGKSSVLCLVLCAVRPPSRGWTSRSREVIQPCQGDSPSKMAIGCVCPLGNWRAPWGASWCSPVSICTPRDWDTQLLSRAGSFQDGDVPAVPSHSPPPILEGQTSIICLRPRTTYDMMRLGPATAYLPGPNAWDTIKVPGLCGLYLPKIWGIIHEILHPTSIY